MRRSVTSLLRLGRTLAFQAFVLLGALPIRHAVAQPAPQSATTDPTTKKVLSVADYTRWRNIEGAQISSDGKWVAYALRFTNTLPDDGKPVLHLMNLESNQDVEIANASNASFSPDARWVVYQVDSIVAARGGRGGRGAAPAGDSSAVAPPAPGGGAPAVAPPAQGRGAATPPPPPRRMELRELASGRTQSWQDMAAGTFSATSTHLLLRRRAAAGGGRGGRGGAPDGGAGGVAPASAAGPRGTNAVLHDLTTGRSQFLGSVGDAAFNRKGDLFAYTVDAEVRDGNGLFLVDLPTGRMQPLDNDARTYNRLTWSDNGSALAVLKGKAVERMRERNNLLIVFTDVRASMTNAELPPATLDPAMAAGFPKGFVVSDRAPLMWSEDNQRVFFGIISQQASPDTGRRRSTDSIADVDVWRTQDQRIQSVQMIRAEADRNFTYREGFEIGGAKYVPLADSTMRDLEIAADGRWAVGRDTRGYISDYKRPAADLYRVNTTTGERTLMMKGQLIGQHVFGISPDGHTYLYWKDNKYQAYDLDAGTSKTLGAGGEAT